MAQRISDLMLDTFEHAMAVYPDEFHWEVIPMMIQTPAGDEPAVFVLLTLKHPDLSSKSPLMVNTMIPHFALYEASVCKKIALDMTQFLRAEKAKWLAPPK